MQSGFDPYTPPAADTSAPATGQPGSVRRLGSLLKVEPAALPPAICARCGQQARTRVPMRLYWHRWTVYLLLFIAVPLYILVALVVRRRIDMGWPLCEQHLTARRRWRQAARASTVAMLVGVASFAFAGTGAAIGFALLIAGLLGALTSAAFGRRLAPRLSEIESDGSALVKNAHPALLEAVGLDERPRVAGGVAQSGARLP